MARLWKVLDASAKEKLDEIHDRAVAGNETNTKFWQGHAPFEWAEKYVSTSFSLADTIEALEPKDLELLENPPKGWKKRKDCPTGLWLDTRTKIGKDLEKKYREEHVQVVYWCVTEALGLEDAYGRFTIPRVYRAGEETFVHLDQRYDLEKDIRFEEVTISYVNAKIAEHKN